MVKFWLNFFAAVNVAAAVFMGWLTYKAILGADTAGLVIFGIGSLLAAFIGVGLYIRLNLARLFFLGFQYFSLTGNILEVLLLIYNVLVGSEISKSGEEALLSVFSNSFAIIINIVLIKFMRSEDVRVKFAPNQSNQAQPSAAGTH